MLERKFAVFGVLITPKLGTSGSETNEINKPKISWFSTTDIFLRPTTEIFS